MINLLKLLQANPNGLTKRDMRDLTELPASLVNPYLDYLLDQGKVLVQYEYLARKQGDTSTRRTSVWRLL